jgi:hypothetical protein
MMMMSSIPVMAFSHQNQQQQYLNQIPPISTFNQYLGEATEGLRRERLFSEGSEEEYF